jgi:hypothetical protein
MRATQSGTTGSGRARLLVAGVLGLTGCLGDFDFGDGGGDSMTARGSDGGSGGDLADPTGLASEEFPPELLAPYGGMPITDYDNTFVNLPQLRARVKAVFGDDWMRGGVDQWAKNITLFGGVDFTSHFAEPRGATSDFLLGLDVLAKDVCGQAAANKSGPFAGIDPTLAIAGTGKTQAVQNIDTVYQRMLFRPAEAQDESDAYQLLTDLVGYGVTTTSAWSGLCEALIRHPDFLFTLAPSYASATGATRTHLMLLKVAQDLTGRPPTQAEFDLLGQGKTIGDMVDDYLSSKDFQNYFFYKMRIRTQSAGTADADEPARLWTYVIMNDRPLAELFTADYTADASFAQATRDASHGKTGLLTMKGYIAGKPGLPHFTYASRVLGDFMGVTFNVPQSIIDMRLNSTAASTVDPTSVCFSCHQTLTPLEEQRARWADDGTYSATDASGATIDDSDHGLVAGYPFKGEGMEAFATQAVKKEAFIRQMLNAHFLLLFGREMRATLDERVIYKQLWDLNVQSNGDLRQIMKAIILSPTYQGM